MILASKLSEFIALSILAFIYDNYFMYCIYLSIMCLALENSMLESLFEDF
jgi:hypothetical protein